VPLYNPPDHITRRLAQFYSLLRIRWGDHSVCWLIERKLIERESNDPT